MTANPLSRYRAAQRRVRRLFEPFTQVHCEGCLTPCCRKPTWVRPLDVVLVQELGYPLPMLDSAGPAQPLLDAASDDDPTAGEPCDYLGEHGCSFPADLRPFGCASFICDPMHRLMPAPELARLESAVEELRDAHAGLLLELHQPANG
jgi:hypothetical protein